MQYNERKKYEIQFRRWLFDKSPSKRLDTILGDKKRYVLFFKKLLGSTHKFEDHAKTWQIDHIVPIVNFKNDEIDLCWSIENLRAMEKDANRLKGASLIESKIEIDLRLKYYPTNKNLLSLMKRIDNNISKQTNEYIYKIHPDLLDN